MVGILNECGNLADLKRDRDICQEKLNAAQRKINEMSQEVWMYFKNKKKFAGNKIIKWCLLKVAKLKNVIKILVNQVSEKKILKAPAKETRSVGLQVSQIKRGDDKDFKVLYFWIRITIETQHFFVNLGHANLDPRIKTIAFKKRNECSSKCTEHKICRFIVALSAYHNTQNEGMCADQWWRWWYSWGPDPSWCRVIHTTQCTFGSKFC